MVEITFVRHGQANSAATDEKDYDRLSDLGSQQAIWLGDHFAETGRSFDHVIAGTLNRQRTTAELLAARLGLTVAEDVRLNEMDYFGLAQSLTETHALPIPTDREGFVLHMPQVLLAWQAAEIGSPRETFEGFETRVAAMIAQAETLGGRILLVTSGGVIAMAMRLLLRLEIRSFAHVLLQCHNASIHRYVKVGDILLLDTFNATPHLERPDRAHARTYI